MSIPPDAFHPDHPTNLSPPCAGWIPTVRAIAGVLWVLAIGGAILDASLGGRIPDTAVNAVLSLALGVTIVAVGMEARVAAAPEIITVRMPGRFEQADRESLVQLLADAPAPAMAGVEPALPAGMATQIWDMAQRAALRDAGAS